MGYDQFIQSTLENLGFDVVTAFNCFQPPYDPKTGWRLRLPEVDFKPNTLVLLHFQDFVSPGQNIIELTKVEQFYGDRSNQVLVAHLTHGLDQHYQGPINLIRFSSISLIGMQSIQDRQSEWQGRFDGERPIAWQCLNGRECPHRGRTAEVLRHWPDGILSYGNSIPLDHWPYKTYFGTENDENFIRLLDVYARCRVNIVTETQYDSRPGLISEKTFFAMVAQQVPIIIGHPGIVNDCRELGFDTFDDLVDTSYDYLPNSQRVEQALYRNRDLILGRADIGPWRARLQKQHHYVLNGYIESIKQHFAIQSGKLASHFSISP